MHLLVLSAFRLDRVTIPQPILPSLNAPSGAQCFPTADARASHTSVAGLNAPSGAQCFPTWGMETRRTVREGLNAPSGAQCFPTGKGQDSYNSEGVVSMHLLVLSAFRLRPQKTAPQRRLPERNRRRPGKHHIESARTCPIKPHNREKPPQTTPAPPTPPTSQYATDFQPTQAKKPTPHNYARVNFVLLGV